MKNLLSEKPTSNLHGRLKYITNFINNNDLTDKNILDIGCGFGWFELYVLSNNPHLIVGTEISKDDLFTINHYLHDSRLKTCIGDGTNLPFRSKSFDTVVSWDVLEHVKRNKDIRMFQEVARVIKTGGYFYLSTPYASFQSILFDPAWYLISHRHYSLNQIIRMADFTGFVLVETHLRGGFWDIIQTLDMYFSKWVLGRKPILSDKLIKMVDKEYQHKGIVSLFVKLKKC
jgi:2-polyprenyl-3-methyl-5-hydroxy-6-metoxy-1,4-benzoquinol methylase